MKKLATATLLRPFFSPSSSTITNSLSLIYRRHFSTSNKTDDKEWNDAWETAWLPEDDTHSNITTTTTSAAPWDSDATNFDAIDDSETKAFIEDMNQNWHQRRNNHPNKNNVLNNIIDAQNNNKNNNNNDNDNNNRDAEKEDDYRLKKQRIHASLWSKQIHQLHESKLGSNDDDIDNLLHSCSELFDSGGDDQKVPSSSEFKNKPDGWETTSKPEDGNVWEMSQREEDILLQEFERRMAFCKFQIASFIKTHIFSRRRPIDGWKYMIEVIGPNAKKGKGGVSRIPGLADPATQPFTEERAPISGRVTSRRAR